MNRFEWIHSMSIEEMAERLAMDLSICIEEIFPGYNSSCCVRKNGCVDCIKECLLQDHKDDEITNSRAIWRNRERELLYSDEIDDKYLKNIAKCCASGRFDLDLYSFEMILRVFDECRRRKILSDEEIKSMKEKAIEHYHRLFEKQENNNGEIH